MIYYNFRQKIASALKISMIDIVVADTISIEMMSALSGILIGIGLFIELNILPGVGLAKPKEFWGMVIVILSVLQLCSTLLIFTQSVAVLRSALALIAGSFWFWLGLEQISDPANVVSLVVGLFCFKAFICNVFSLTKPTTKIKEFECSIDGYINKN